MGYLGYLGRRAAMWVGITGIMIGLVALYFAAVKSLSWWIPWYVTASAMSLLILLAIVGVGHLWSDVSVRHILKTFAIGGGIGVVVVAALVAMQTFVINFATLGVVTADGFLEAMAGLIALSSLVVVVYSTDSPKTYAARQDMQSFEEGVNVSADAVDDLSRYLASSTSVVQSMALEALQRQAYYRPAQVAKHHDRIIELATSARDEEVQTLACAVISLYTEVALDAVREDLSRLMDAWVDDYPWRQYHLLAILARLAYYEPTDALEYSEQILEGARGTAGEGVETAPAVVWVLTQELERIPADFARDLVNQLAAARSPSSELALGVLHVATHHPAAIEEHYSDIEDALETTDAMAHGRVILILLALHPEDTTVAKGAIHSLGSRLSSPNADRGAIHGSLAEVAYELPSLIDEWAGDIAENLTADEDFVAGTAAWVLGAIARDNPDVVAVYADEIGRLLSNERREDPLIHNNAAWALGQIARDHPEAVNKYEADLSEYLIDYPRESSPEGIQLLCSGNAGLAIAQLESASFNFDRVTGGATRVIKNIAMAVSQESDFGRKEHLSALLKLAERHPGAVNEVVEDLAVLQYDIRRDVRLRLIDLLVRLDTNEAADIRAQLAKNNLPAVEEGAGD